MGALMKETAMRRVCGLVLLLCMGLAPAAAHAWWNKAWSYRKQVTVDATPTGVNVSGPIGRVPVLIRLHSGNFSFKDAVDNGSDLRFVGADDKTPLTYHIESYDPLLGVGTIWVDVPAIAGGSKAQLWMYYGNKNVGAGVDSAGTFDPDYTLVYHYDTPAGTAPTDKTANKNNASNPSAGVNDGGIIGRSARFSGGLPITVPATGSTAIAAGSAFTFSTWVKPDAGATGALFAKREGTNSLLVALAGGVPTLTTTGGTPVSLRGTAVLTPGQWSHVAVTFDGKQAALFVGGRPVATAAAVLPAIGGAETIGGDNGQGFAGELDETRTSKVARTGNVLFLDASGQGQDGKLIGFGKDEEQGSGGGVIGFILNSVSSLDWGIIGTCMALLAAAIGVIVWKAGYIGNIAGANAAFQRLYSRFDGDLEPLDELNLTPDEMATLRQSPLARIYNNGMVEVEHRRKLYGNIPLSDEAVHAIRSELDACQTVENQKLDKFMVLLTIAISGGPFIGLLGTVIGVMITFGGVALAGDVNVNAIAPGIAAALLATIAGLAAAIPALFGYNYLNSQITEIADAMRVFVDRLVTRLAEMQSDRANPLPPLAMAAE